MRAWLSPVGLQALTVGATDSSHRCAPAPPARAWGGGGGDEVDGAPSNANPPLHLGSSPLDPRRAPGGEIIQCQPRDPPGALEGESA